MRVMLSIPTGAETGAQEWLTGAPMDPVGVSVEPLPTVAGFPFLHPSMSAVIVGPTGGGRSSLVQACAYDAGKVGVRVGYLGFEVSPAEFNARAARLAGLRGDDVDDSLREQLAQVRYLDLPSVIAQAWEQPEAWVAGVDHAFEVVVIDPLSAVESVLGLNFERSNNDYARFFDWLVQPLIARQVAVVLVDNVGHAAEARSRAKGASAKSDRADLTFSCSLMASPVGLVLRAQKVRSARAAVTPGDEWEFLRDTQTITRRERGEAEESFRPTELMERASRFLEAQPGATLNAIKREVRGKGDYIAAAVRVLVAEGLVERRDEGQARCHYSVRPYRQEEDPRLAPTGPQGSRASTGQGAGPQPVPDQPLGPVIAHRSPGPRVRSTGTEGPVSDGQIKPLEGESYEAWDARVERMFAAGAGD